MIVVDANTIVYLFRETTFTPLARRLYEADPDWIVPPLWKPEVLNALLQEVKAGSVSAAGAIEAAENASRLLSDRVRDCEPAVILKTANETGLTAYDAYYVVLARLLGVVLVTQDKKILRACPDGARSMKSFLEPPESPAVIRERRAAYSGNKSIRKKRIRTTRRP